MLTVPLSRAEFETLTRDLLMRTRLTTQQVLRQAGLTWDQVDRVLLVGGSTHMPMTGQMLQELTGKAPDNSLAVSEVVARGAALHAGIVAAHGTGEDLLDGRAARDMLGQVVEINVNSHSLGIEVKHGAGTHQRHADPEEHAAADRRQPGLLHRRREPAARARQGAARRGARRPTPASASANAGSRDCRRTCRNTRRCRCAAASAATA